jgi:hypothetical protein
MAITYEPIVSTTLTSATTSVVFGSIPATYTDLVLVSTILDPNGYVVMRYNSDSGNNYSRTWMFGNGSTAGSNRGSNISGLDLKAKDASSGSEYAPTITQIMNYSNTTTYKTTLISQAFSGEVAAYVGLWRSTSAINTITLTNDMKTGCTFTLYGIKAE